MIKIIYVIIYYLGIHKIVRKLNQCKKVTIILYHNIGCEEFKSHVDEINKFYNIIELQDYIRWRCDSGSFSMPENALVITFDDGVKELYNLKIIFEELGVKPTIFLIAGLLNTNIQPWDYKIEPAEKREKMKYLNKEERNKFINNEFSEVKNSHRVMLNRYEIEEMRDVVDFQSHTVTHESLITCTKEESLYEIIKSKEILEKNFKLKINCIAYPFGLYTEREKTLTKFSGYECGLSVDPGYNDNNTDIYAVKRFCVNGNDDKYKLHLKITGVWKYFKTFI